MTRSSRALSAATRRWERVDRAARTTEVLAELDQLDTDDPEGEQRHHLLVDQLIEINMGVARSIASRYRNRGVQDDDLEGVAYVALVRAAHTYDHSRGYDFLSYAVPCIRGEVRRHFRDKGWMVRPPRRVQENQARINAVESELTTHLGRPPTAAELAHHLDVSEADVMEALSASGCFSPTSLDQSAHGSESIGGQLGEHDPGLDAVEARAIVTPLVRRLSDRERRILEMRFCEDCTQQEIADEIGVTQMQVSRLLNGLMARLRADVQPDPTPVA